MKEESKLISYCVLCALVDVNVTCHIKIAINYTKMLVRNWNFSTFASISGQFYETGTELYATHLYA